MDRTPSPLRIFLRGLAWAPALGAAVGVAVWISVCTLLFSPPALLYVAFAAPVGAVLGLVPGLVGSGVVATVARHTTLRRGDAAAVAAAACGGPVLDISVVGLLAGGPMWAVLGWGVVATVLTAGTGAIGGLLVVAPLHPTAVSARRNGAAAAAGTASPGWSPAPGR